MRNGIDDFCTSGYGFCLIGNRKSTHADAKGLRHDRNDHIRTQDGIDDVTPFLISYLTGQ